jgi:hypothetical protein
MAKFYGDTLARLCGSEPDSRLVETVFIQLGHQPVVNF